MTVLKERKTKNGLSSLIRLSRTCSQSIFLFVKPVRLSLSFSFSFSLSLFLSFPFSPLSLSLPPSLPPSLPLSLSLSLTVYQFISFPEFLLARTYTKILHKPTLRFRLPKVPVSSELENQTTRIEEEAETMEQQHACERATLDRLERAIAAMRQADNATSASEYSLPCFSWL